MARAEAAAASNGADQPPADRETVALLDRLERGEESLEEIIGKPPSQVTQAELDRVVSSDAYWSRLHPLNDKANDFASSVFDHVWGPDAVKRDVSGKMFFDQPANPQPTAPSPALAADGGSITDGVVQIGREIARASGASRPEKEVRTLQATLNEALPVGDSRFGAPLEIDGRLGPITARRMRRAVREIGVRPVLAAFGRNRAA